jgi:V8-like Glu-specific endopeptidase
LGDCAAQTALVEGGGTPLAVRVAFKEEAAAVGSLQWTKKFARPGSQFLRVHFSNFHASPQERFALRIVDRTGRVVMEVTDGNRGSFWSPVVEGDTLEVAVYANSRPTELSFNIDRMVFQRMEGVKYSIPGSDEREQIYEMPPEIQLRARPVGKLQFVSDGVPKSCTGFLVGPTSFVTNNHCVQTQDECESAVVTFGYQYEASGALDIGDKVSCSRLVITSQPLDFSVLELAADAGDIWGTLTLADHDPNVGDPALLIEHGGGMPKQISRVKCKVTVEPAEGREKDTDFGHVCDTLEGASGSPILDANFKVIGLHHFGFEAPGPWSEQNRAVRATKIRDILLTQGVIK